MTSCRLAYHKSVDLTATDHAYSIWAVYRFAVQGELLPQAGLYQVFVTSISLVRASTAAIYAESEKVPF